MKKFLSMLMALTLVFTLVACGNKNDFPRDENGYLTADAAKSVATESFGYTSDDVYFNAANFTGDGSGTDTDAVFHFEFTDTFVVYTVEVNALDGSITLSEAR